MQKKMKNHVDFADRKRTYHCKYQMTGNLQMSIIKKETEFLNIKEREGERMKKWKVLFCAAAIGAAMCTAATVNAETFTTDDGVVSIETPDETQKTWAKVVDPNYWFVISDGDCTITMDHLSNGEKLPEVKVADKDTPGVFQAFVSTQNEVFVVKAQAADIKDLRELMEIVGTVQVLKYDTKTAINKDAAPEASQFGLRPINAVYYVNAPKLNVRAGCSTNDTILGVLSYGDQVTVRGAVTKDGADYGWYQVTYNGTTAYVSAGFISAQKPAAPTTPTPTPAPAADPKPLASGFPAFDGWGNPQGNLVPYSDGYYYSNDMQKYVDNGDESYYGINTGDTLYSYDPTAYNDDYSPYPDDEKQSETGTAGSNYYDDVITHLLSDADTGDEVYISALDDGSYVWTDASGLGYTDNGDGTFSDNNGNLYYLVW